MSEKHIGNSPPEPTGPFENDIASSVWNLDEALHYVKMGRWPTSFNSKPSVEDVFSSTPYKGTSASLTITNGLNLSGDGGLVWIKNRTTFNSHAIFDTERQSAFLFYLNGSSPESGLGQSMNTYTNSGFILGTDQYTNIINDSASHYSSFSFKKSPAFLDIVKYQGGSGENAVINHNLGTEPGMIIIVNRDSNQDRMTYHISCDTDIKTNSIDPKSASASTWFPSTPSASTFTVGGEANGGGAFTNNNYIAYVFAHDNSPDSVIKCGTYTGAAESYLHEVELGWEPQWVMIKNMSSTSNWIIIDAMLGGTGYHSSHGYYKLDSTFENLGTFVSTKSNGFRPRGTNVDSNNLGDEYLYIAIKRPEKIPTSGSQVFDMFIGSAYGNSLGVIGGDFIGLTKAMVDSVIWTDRDRSPTSGTYVIDQVRGMRDSGTTSAPSYNIQTGAGSTTVNVGNFWFDYKGSYSLPSSDGIMYGFIRQPGFFDIVTYKGSYPTRPVVRHGLKVIPEMAWVKQYPGSTFNGWQVFHKDIEYYYLMLDKTDAKKSSSSFRFSGSTSTDETIYVTHTGVYPGSAAPNNTEMMAYLFASTPNVSKVGSYTGNGTSQTINCDFTAGARFVMIKRTDAVGDWWFWDAARGIVSGDDPVLALNNILAESAYSANDSIDPESSGFIVNENIVTSINTNGGNYIFYSIA